MCAGIAFSRNPITGARIVLIEANYGLGSTVTAGSVSPDLLTVSQNGGVKIKIGSKLRKAVLDSTGIALRRVSKPDRSRAVLSHDTARAIARMALRLERDLGQPQDIEWALTKKGISILQARPIIISGRLK
jgi:pyruvate,water dikinase